MITFREYLRELEKYTDQNLLDQVVAHSTHILKSYPNSVDALRYLGQAYLEEKKYSEASVCFDKVLSFIPDDFVSHIGMTAVKEEARELDAAIYHMEMAFDTQPSNNIVQDELKRLINKRDGTQPSKINLSKGALIRMYMKGDLLQQALNEIEASISTAPDRIDLKILLAQVYYLSNLKVPAAETCNQVLERLPYCLEPNQILFDIYLESGLVEQANIVKERLVSVNPYYQYLDSPRMTVEEIPDEKVELERLNYTSAFSAGIEDYLPAHIPSQSEYKPETRMSKETLKPNKFNSDLDNKSGSIPDFMSTAGWEISQNPSNEPPEPISDSLEQLDQLPAEKSKLPDWLENFQVSNEFTEKKSVFLPEEPLGIIIGNDQEIVSNIDQTPNMNLSSISEVEMTNDTPQSPLPQDDSSDWMSQFFDEAKNSSSESEEDKVLPEWLKSFDQKEPDDEASANEDVPDWLKTLDSEIVSKDLENQPITQDTQNSESSKNEEPDWLRSLVSDDSVQDLVDSNLSTSEDVTVAIENLQPVESDKSSFSFIDEIRDTEISLADGEVDIENPIETENTSENDQGFDNNDFFKSLEGLSSDKSSTEQTFFKSIEDDKTVTENTENVVPDWVKSVLSSSEEPSPETISDSAPSKDIPESPLVTTEEISVNQETELINDATQGAISQEASDELLEWLRGITPDSAESQILDEDRNLPVSEDQEVSESIDESLDRLNEVSNAYEDPIATSLVIEKTEDLMVPTSIEETEDLMKPTSIDENIAEFPSSLVEESTEFSGTPENELQAVSDPSNQIDPMGKLQSILSENNYSEVSFLLVELIKTGIEPDKILTVFTSFKTEKSNDFDFLQLLGDTLASFDHYDEAMEAYTQAENLLK